MGFANELKSDVDGLARELKNGVENFAGEVRESFGNLKGRVSHGAEEVETALADGSLDSPAEVRKPSWKLVLGAVAGIALIGAAVLMARRRAQPANLLQRGLREGSKYAVLIPLGLQKARASAEHLSREAVRQWDKLPHIQIKVK